MGKELKNMRKFPGFAGFSENKLRMPVPADILPAGFMITPLDAVSQKNAGIRQRK